MRLFLTIVCLLTASCATAPPIYTPPEGKVCVDKKMLNQALDSITDMQSDQEELQQLRTWKNHMMF